MGTPPEHVVVGVDIGYTCTGVAIYSTRRFISPGTSQGKIQPVVLQDWPDCPRTGKKVNVYNKVPTRLTYKAGDLRALSWGFSCLPREELDEAMLVREHFKLLLEDDCLVSYNERLKNEQNTRKDKNQRSQNDKEIIENVHKWFVDFLDKLERHIAENLENPPWRVDFDDTKVDYIFSLPTAWKENKVLVERFQQIIEEAGFASGQNCTATTGLSEAVASAVWTAKVVNHKFKETFSLFVTLEEDICVLKVIRFDNKTVEMEKLDSPISIFAGSVQIDKAFEDAFEKKLSALKEEDPQLFKEFAVSKHAAHIASRDRFQMHKENWGQATATNCFSISVHPDVQSSDKDSWTSGAKVEGFVPRIKFSADEFNAIFDEQIFKIVKILDMVLGNVREKVVHRSRALFSPGVLVVPNTFKQSLRDITSFKAFRYSWTQKEENRLVYDHMQRIIYGTSVLSTRICCASYGILYDKVFNKSEHQGKGRDCYRDPADGKKYVRNEIYWFITDGQEIKQNDSITFSQNRQMSAASPEGSWTNTIVLSKHPPDLLPNHFDKRLCTNLTTFTSDCDWTASREKRRFPLFGGKFLRGTYDVCISVEEEKLNIETKVGGEVKGSCLIPDIPWEFVEKKKTDTPNPANDFNN
ncbi:hypothetical protein G7Y89_g12658 [Cudoniella acicularis]|uniref:Uncharacterized protein n=1 Tax=Cudoniella acicularis TaxID=354080 RepID=A0A8H4R9N7_9HELO|nr:hypothetical protein G7Y89_g12658 [Cudoniella acicularis]